MTTPQVPANTLSVSEISDEINPPGYTQAAQDVGANAVVRQLTGTASKSRQGVELLIGADLQNKTAYSQIIASAATNTQISVGDVTSEITLTANSDMFEPNMTWSFVINGDSSNVVSSDINVTKLSDVSKQAVVSLLTTGGTKQANLTVTGVMTIGQHVVNTCTRDIRLTTTSSNTALSVTATPSFTLDASGVVAQTAVITVKASANASLASDTTFVFTPTFVTGTGALTPDIKADSVTFVATAATPIVNSAIYNLTTDMFYLGRKVSTNNVTVDIRAEYQDRIITSIAPSATVNNNFANSGSQYATIDVVATHNAVGPTFTQGTITFTVEVTGNTVTQQTISSNTSQKTERIRLYHDFDADSFGFKKAVVNVVATLRSPTNQIIDEKRIDGLVLRAGAYGLSVVEASSNSQIGHSAQTSTTQATASWRAGDFSWSTREFSGSGPTNIITTDNNTRTSRVDIRSTTPSAKNRSQAITNTSSFDITGTLSFDNVTARVVTINDILIKSEALPYTYTISTPSLSNTQIEIDGATVASITVTGTTSVGTITWARDNGSVGITTTSTTANVFVTSSFSSGSNTQSVIVTGNLLDPTSRVIETLSTQSISLNASTNATGNITLTAGPSGSKYFTIVDKPVNGFGYHEAHPNTVSLSQNVAYTASFTSATTLTNPRFIFSSSGGGTLFANTISGQANLVGQSIYTDSEPPTTSIVSNQSTIRVQLSTDGRPVGTTASQNFNFSLPLPPGRCYRLATFSTNGVRQQHTRDPFGNTNEQVNYSRVPSAASLLGPETKWMGLHDGSRIYEQSQRPLYHSSGKRLYSSTAHRSQHGNEQPNEIIPTNYFMILSFSETGTPSIGSVYLVGVDGVIYGPLKLYTAGSQNDTRRDNDAFHFAIYEWNGSVACNYCFISNVSGDGFTPPPARPPSGTLELRAAQIGSAQIADRVDLNIGNIVGGFVSEDTSGGNVGDVELFGGGTFSGTDSLIGLSQNQR